MQETASTVIQQLVGLWNGWYTQFLVLFSLMLQFVLLFLAGVRRHKSGGVRMGILWLAYQLADYITTYAMGNLAGSSALPKHRLVAFWGPFLLLHLGGPDNIAAYELEDNKLWKRQILTLVGQGLGAGYVLYKHISGGGGGALFSLAAIFVAVVGFVKFCEKIFALRHASLSTIRDSVRTETPANCTVFLEYELPRWGLFVRNKEELLKRHAHALFHVCKSAMVDSSVDDLGPNRSNHGGATRLLKDFKNQDAKYRWTLMEMELSLMYDILYTKAAMVHSLPGYCIRVSSSLVVAASLLLFQFSSKAGYSGVDIAITYALLAGAFLLEVKSLLSAVFSTWTFAFLCTTRWSRLRHAILCSGRWDRFRRLVVSLHLLAYVKTIADYLRLSKRWHGTIGQCSMLDMCIRGLSVSDSRLRAWMLGSRTWTVNVPKMVKERVVEHIDGIIKKDDINTLGVIRLNWGVMALKHHNFEVEEARLGAEVQEGIVIWHIATDILLAGMGKLGTKDTDVKAIKAISQYMMFLLVERPAMLPGLAQIKLYQRTERTLANQCEGAINLSPASWRDGGPSSVSRLERREELANRLRDDKPKLDELGISSRVVFAVDLAKKLPKREEQNKDSLQIVLDVWIDILVYTANRCSRESHAMQLSRGGEFTTLIWLMAEHYHQAGFQQ